MHNVNVNFLETDKGVNYNVILNGTLTDFKLTDDYLMDEVEDVLFTALEKIKIERKNKNE